MRCCYGDDQQEINFDMKKQLAESSSFTSVADVSSILGDVCTDGAAIKTFGNREQ